MAASNNVAPIIIKKVKKSGGDGHHGGAWKVAYADFVTAMMAFFMLMWLLNATTEQQRTGIADYFSPTIAISRSSGGGSGTMGGDTVYSEDTFPKNGTGASMRNPTESNQARGQTGETSGSQDQAFKEMEQALMGLGGESLIEENALKHVVSKVTDEGLVFEIFDLPGMPLFDGQTAEAQPILQVIARMLGDVTNAVTNPVAVGAHVASEPLVIRENNVWDLSSERADVMRQLLEQQGMDNQRVHRVTGFADRRKAVNDPMSPRNNRLEIILLRR